MKLKKPLGGQKTTRDIPLKFNPSEYEGKWQSWWEENRIYKTPESSDRWITKGNLDFRIQNSELKSKAKHNFQKKQYILDMFPYPSAQGLHVGHPEGYTATDIYSRYLRMKGFDVLHPMGWDAFGLPAENFAIKQGVHPEKTTLKSIQTFKKQIKSLGFSYDWDKEINTSSSEYYRFTQWLFEFMYKRGLAYRKKAPANWCPSCQTVLANEQVISGKCERCKTQVVQKDIEQWFFKITDFAERLLSDLDKIDWPISTKTGQRNWIGKSEGMLVRFPILEDGKENSKFEIKNSKQNQTSKLKSQKYDKNFVEVFTTRVDTIFGVTFVALAPEHTLVLKITKPEFKTQVEEYMHKTAEKNVLQRTSLEKEKTGVFTGGYVVNPMNGESVPVYVADYVVMDYGNGAVMGVPAHDSRDYDFARKMNLPIRVVCLETSVYNKLTQDYSGNNYIGNMSEKSVNLREIITANKKNYFPHKPQSSELTQKEFVEQLLSFGFKLPYENLGVSVNSGKYSGKTSVENLANISKYIEEKGFGKRTVRYKLRDWLISRQRYWGAPIPVIYCSNCVALQKSLKLKGQSEKLNNNNFINTNFEVATIDGVEYAIHLVPEKDLPVFLPKDVDFRPTGESPLLRSKSFHEVKCPVCGAKARRESDTMDTFVCSSWYYLAYPFWEKHKQENSKLEARNSKQIQNFNEKYLKKKSFENSNLKNSVIVSDLEFRALNLDENSAKSIFEIYQEEIRQWLPVDLYVGGAEHTVLHLLYSRFVTKALHDAGLVDFDEPFMKLRHIGMILGLDGQKMSKSRGNVINPDDIVSAFGADTMRLYEMFMGPLSDKKPWNEHGVEGVYRFLKRVWQLYQSSDNFILSQENNKLWQLTQELVSQVEKDILELKFNTAIAKMMSWLNEATEEIRNSNIKTRNKIPNLKLRIQDSLKVFLLVLAPFAPHLAEELWLKLWAKENGEIEVATRGSGNQEKNKIVGKRMLSDSGLKSYRSIHQEKWPEVDKSALNMPKTCVFLVEVSGKIIEKISFQENDERYQKQSEVEKMVMGMEKVIAKLEILSLKQTGVNSKLQIKKVIFIPKKLINFVV